MDTAIEKITGDNRRPGMPQEGYLVRWELWQYGWKHMKTFATLQEAEEFAHGLENNKQGVRR